MKTPDAIDSAAKYYSLEIMTLRSKSLEDKS